HYDFHQPRFETTLKKLTKTIMLLSQIMSNNNQMLQRSWWRQWQRKVTKKNCINLFKERSNGR
ncbi:MAG: hypothetical protein ACK53Y_19640, partial [bacterium]